MRWCWVNLQCRGVLLTWIRVGQGPTVLAVGAGGGCLDIFSVYHFSFLSPSLWETVRYRLKYCLKGPLSPKQPTYFKPVYQYPKLRDLFARRNITCLSFRFLFIIQRDGMCCNQWLHIPPIFHVLNKLRASFNPISMVAGLGRFVFSRRKDTMQKDKTKKKRHAKRRKKPPCKKTKRQNPSREKTKKRHAILNYCVTRDYVIYTTFLEKHLYSL